MSFPIALAHIFFEEQFGERRSTTEELWELYGTPARSGCRLWDEPWSTADDSTLEKQGTEATDWPTLIQEHRRGSSHRQYFAQFFSPPSAIEIICTELFSSQKSILDPSCGVGCFLLQIWDLFIQKGYSDLAICKRLYAVDLDPELVAVTRFRLFQKSLYAADAGRIIQGRIHHGDALLRPKNDILPPPELQPTDWASLFPKVFAEGGFQLIVGNPPFLFLSGRGAPVKKLRQQGLIREANTLQQRLALYKVLYSESSNGCRDLYKYFVQLCTELLSPTGHLGLITPSSWIRLTRYQAVRQILLRNRLYRIEEFGQKHFPELTVPSSILFAGRSSETIHYLDHRNHTELILPKEDPFQIYANPLLAPLFQMSTAYLGDLCTIREGLHKYSAEANEQELIPSFQLSKLSAFHCPSTEMIPRPKSFNANAHSGQRILLRKTGDSLICALVKDPSLCLTHQNCYVIHAKESFSPKALEVLLNSKLLTILYQASPCGQKGRPMAQLRIWGLKQLPIPDLLQRPELQLELCEAHKDNRVDDFLLQLWKLSSTEETELRAEISRTQKADHSDDQK